MRKEGVVEARKDSVSRLVIVWKLLSGIEKNDKVWDRVFWGRCAKSAKNLLLMFDGDIELAADAMAECYEKLDKLGVSFTMETVVRHCFDWRAKNAKSSRTK